MTMKSAGGGVCPDCGSSVAVRLLPGESCPQCESSKAWERYSGRAEKLIIGVNDIANAESRLGTRGGAPAAAKYWLAGVAAFVLSLVAIFFVRDLLAARPLGPLAPLYAHMQRAALATAALGLLALVVGVFSTFAQKRGALFRNAPLLVVNLAAVVVGATTILVGGFHWGGASGVGWAHMAMPPLQGTSASLSVQEESIMSATTVLVAPDRDGDARGMSLGSGAVIRSERGAAFVGPHVGLTYAEL